MRNKPDQIAKEIWDMIQNRLEIYDLTKEEIMDVFDGLAANCNDVVEEIQEDPGEGEWNDDDDDDEDYADEDDDGNFEEDWDDDFEEENA